MLAGHVFIVAGSEPKLGEIADALTTAGALVAVVGPLAPIMDVATHFRTDPTDRQVWERVVPHVEQRLGPIDGVVADHATHTLGEEFVGPDLCRRGHGAVIAVDGGAAVDDVLRKLIGTP